MRFTRLVITTTILAMMMPVNSLDGKNSDYDDSFEYLPYIAYVFGKFGGCTGIAIHSKWLVVPGHCVVNKFGVYIKEDGLQISVGTPTIELRDWNRYFTLRSERIIVQVEFGREIGQGDIALVKVDTSKSTSADLIPVAVDNKPWLEMYNGIRGDCKIIGWRKNITKERGIINSKSILNYLVARHGPGACPCIEEKEVYDKVICIDGLFTNTFCGSAIGGALICGGRLTGVTHQVVECRLCSSQAEFDNCWDGRSVYQVYTYLCPYRKWLNAIVPELGIYDFNCAAAAHRGNSIKCQADMFVNMYIVTLIILKIFIVFIHWNFHFFR